MAKGNDRDKTNWFCKWWVNRSRWSDWFVTTFKTADNPLRCLLGLVVLTFVDP